MNPSLSSDQLKLLSETAAGTPEPATRRSLMALSRLGLLSFDGGGRYEVTAQGPERLVAEAPNLH